MDTSINLNLLSSAPLLRQRMNGYSLSVPPGDSAITSLTCGPKGYVFGATTGRQNSYLFIFDNICNQKITVLANLKQPAGIYHSLVSDTRENLFFGTMPPIDFLDRVSLPKGYAGGHLYRFSFLTQPQGSEEGINDTLFSLADSNIIDCGIPVKGEGIQNLLYFPQKNRIYGLTYPNVHLFSYEITTNSFHDNGSLLGKETPSFFQEHLRPRSLIADLEGKIYGTGEKGYLFKLDTALDKFSYLPVQIPGMKARQEWDMAESFFCTPEGIIIGGTTDGYLFKFFPGEERIVNLGKPSMERRIRGLTLGKDNLLYGIAGDCRGASHLFNYDLNKGNYNNMETINYIPVERSSPWTAYNIETLVMDKSGIIYLGERDVTSHLFTYSP